MSVCVAGSSCCLMGASLEANGSEFRSEWERVQKRMEASSEANRSEFSGDSERQKASKTKQRQ